MNTWSKYIVYYKKVWARKLILWPRLVYSTMSPGDINFNGESCFSTCSGQVLGFTRYMSNYHLSTSSLARLILIVSEGAKYVHKNPKWQYLEILFLCVFAFVTSPQGVFVAFKNVDLWIQLLKEKNLNFFKSQTIWSPFHWKWTHVDR